MDKWLIYLLGILSGLVLYKAMSILIRLLGRIDFSSILHYLEIINKWSIKLTTKNIAEIGIILLIVIPVSIFVIKERRRN